MFDVLRKMIVPIIVTVLVLFVAMIVLEWGFDISGRGNQGNPTGAAGTVNGEEIPWQAYNNLVTNLYQNEAQKSEEEVPESRMREIEKSAWEQLVHDRLIMQEVERNNIQVTDAEIYAYLKSQPPEFVRTIPEFTTNGQFDYQKYLQTMANPQAAPFWAQLEGLVRDDIRKMKMQELVLQNVQVTEQEVKEAVAKAAEKVKVEFAYVPLSRFMVQSQQFSDAELQAYYDQHSAKYRVGERAVLRIASIEKTPTPADSQAAANLIAAIHDSIVNGAEFAVMAQRYSKDGSAANGGDLGWFGPGQMVEPFNSTAFGLDSGQVSQPIKTQFGWHIIKHHGYQNVIEASPGKPSAEVRKAHAAHILVPITQSQSSIDASLRKMEQVSLAAQDDGLEKAAAAAEVNVVKTEPFVLSGTVPVIGYDETITRFASTQKPGTVSTVNENNSQIFVVEMVEKLPEGTAPFADVKARVRMDVMKQAMLQKCLDTAQAIHQALARGANLETAASQHGARAQTTDWVSRGSSLPEIGRNAWAAAAAFALQTPGEYTKPVDCKSGAAIFKLVARESVTLDTYNQKRDSVLNALKIEKAQEMYSLWFQGVLTNAKIENYVEQYRGDTQAM